MLKLQFLFSQMEQLRLQGDSGSLPAAFRRKKRSVQAAGEGEAMGWTGRGGVGGCCREQEVLSPWPRSLPVQLPRSGPLVLESTTLVSPLQLSTGVT